METEICFSVRYTDIDKMGIVHHSNYPLWFEKGRRDYLRKAGTSNSQIALKGFFLPLSQIECKFKSPARYGDSIIVITKIQSMTCVSIKFKYELYNKETKKLIATGKTVHAWTNQSIKPINIEKESSDIYSRLKQFSETDDNTSTGN